MNAADRELLAELRAIPICDLGRERSDELTRLLDLEREDDTSLTRDERFTYQTSVGCSWAGCTVCKQSVFTGGSGAEIEWWMDKHPARCPGPQDKPKMVRWQDDVFAK